MESPDDEDTEERTWTRAGEAGNSRPWDEHEEAPGAPQDDAEVTILYSSVRYQLSSRDRNHRKYVAQTESLIELLSTFSKTSYCFL